MLHKHQQHIVTTSRQGHDAKTLKGGICVRVCPDGHIDVYEPILWGKGEIIDGQYGNQMTELQSIESGAATDSGDVSIQPYDPYHNHGYTALL